jgi:hypothetical protein
MFMSWERIFFAIRSYSQENEIQNVWSTRRNSFYCLLLQKNIVSSSNRGRNVNTGRNVVTVICTRMRQLLCIFVTKTSTPQMFNFWK